MQHRLKNRYRAAKAFRLNDEGDVCDLYSGGRLPMRHPQKGYECKGVGVRLGVFERYLERHVGQPWDSTYAEICKAVVRKPWLERWLLLDVLVRAQVPDLRPGQLFVESISGLLQRWTP
jgi:hypothetical protein